MGFRPIFVEEYINLSTIAVNSIFCIPIIFLKKAFVNGMTSTSSHPQTINLDGIPISGISFAKMFQQLGAQSKHIPNPDLESVNNFSLLSPTFDWFPLHFYISGPSSLSSHS